MKKFMFLIALITLCCFGAVQAQATVTATETGTITVTVSLAGEVSVSLTPTSWVIGAIALNTTSSPESFTATVGNVSTDLTIMGSGGEGGWAIGTAGSNTFEVAVDTTPSSITLITTDQPLATAVAAYGEKVFNLTYTAPSEDTYGPVSQEFSVTVTASAH